MGCFSCGGNPSTFCRECNYPKDTWIAPVDKLPDTFMGDFDHLFRTPDGNLYALAPERDRWIRVNGEIPKNSLYTGGNGISIDDKGVITNTKPNVNQTLALNGRTLSISDGNNVTIPDTAYNDTELKKRLVALEGKTDKFISNVELSRKGNRVTITYTYVTGERKEVSFEDKDTVGSAYDDSELKSRLVALEGKPDKDNQSLSFNESTRELSISNGNRVTLPSDKQTISKDGYKLVLSNGGGEVELPQPNKALAYDDTAVKNRLKALEDGASGGGVVHRFYDGDITGSGYTTDIVTVNKNRFRNPDGIKVGDTVEDNWSDNNSIIRGTWKVIEVSGDNVKVQGIGFYNIPIRKDLSLNNDTRVLSITGGTSVTLPNDKQTLSYNGKNMSISGGNNVTMETAYNILEEPHGRGIVGAYQQRTTYWLSQPYLFFGRKSLKELGFNVGDKLNFNLFDVYSMFTDMPEEAKISVELYVMGNFNNNLASSYLQQIISNAKLVNHGNHEASVTLTERLLDTNCIVIRVDNFKETNHRLAFQHIQVYGGNYTVNKKLPYSMESFKDEINYLPNTLTLDGWTINGNKSEFHGATSATFTRPADDSQANRDLLTVTTNYPLTPGWYTVGFYAFTDKPSPISCYAYSPNISYVTVNSQSFSGYYGDSANVFNLTKDNDLYWFSFYVPNVEYSKISILLGRQNTDVSKGASITIHRPFLVNGTPNRGYVPDSEQSIQKLTLSGRTLSLSKNGGSVTLPETGVSYNDTEVKQRLTALEGKPDNDKQTLTFNEDTRALSISNGNFVFIPNDKQSLKLNGNKLTLTNGGGSVTLPQSNASESVPIDEYNKVKGALESILTNLLATGAWRQTGATIFDGSLNLGRNIATGNINIFSGATDGGTYIRTNSGATENDLAGGV